MCCFVLIQCALFQCSFLYMSAVCRNCEKIAGEISANSWGGKEGSLFWRTPNKTRKHAKHPLRVFFSRQVSNKAETQVGRSGSCSNSVDAFLHWDNLLAGNTEINGSIQKPPRVLVVPSMTRFLISLFFFRLKGPTRQKGLKESLKPNWNLQGLFRLSFSYWTTARLAVHCAISWTVSQAASFPHSHLHVLVSRLWLEHPRYESNRRSLCHSRSKLHSHHNESLCEMLPSVSCSSLTSWIDKNVWRRPAWSVGFTLPLLIFLCSTK